MNNDIKDLLNAYPVLKNINDKNNNIIEKNMVLKELLADEYLSTNGSSCPGFLFVLSGDIKIQKVGYDGEETNLYNIGRGELCHEALSCFLRYEPLNILGRATQNSRICIIPFDIVEKSLLNDIDFLKQIYKDLHKKFNLIIGTKEEAKYEPLRKRIIKLLVNKKSNIIYLTHAELAFELDSAREVISRNLKELENEGYLKMARGKIQIIKDLKSLL